MTEPTVFIVDDDEAVRASLSMLARSVGLRARTYGDGQAFLDDYHAGLAGCVVADIRMPGLTGLELQDRLNARPDPLPVIILTGHADVPAAVQALKQGAVDFVEKPFDPEALLSAVRQALERDAAQRMLRARESEVASRAAALTPREREIMDLVVSGRASKVIALELEISERTVELHRSRMMKKMGARSLAELLQLASALGEPTPTADGPGPRPRRDVRTA